MFVQFLSLTIQNWFYVHIIFFHMCVTCWCRSTNTTNFIFHWEAWVIFPLSFYIHTLLQHCVMCFVLMCHCVPVFYLQHLWFVVLYFFTEQAIFYIWVLRYVSLNSALTGHIFFIIGSKRYEIVVLIRYSITCNTMSYKIY